MAQIADQCPNCEMPDAPVLSTVNGTRRYRCKACLWSWRTTVAANEGEGD